MVEDWSDCTNFKNEEVKAHLTQTRGHVAMHLEQAKKLRGVRDLQNL